MFSRYFYNNSKVSFLSHNIYLRTHHHVCTTWVVFRLVHYFAFIDIQFHLILLLRHSVAEMILQLLVVGF